jgi:ABC-2 type transport system ATP-binding protein
MLNAGGRHARIAMPDQPPDYAVEVSGLTKYYGNDAKSGRKPALDSLDLAIPRGSLFGLLGPNGAGKSTLINILAGLVIKTSGTAKVWGIDIDVDARNARSAIGVVPQELNIDPFFTPRMLLELQAGLYAVPRRERRTMEILRALRLEDKAEAYARTLSGGMRRRLLVAKALVHSPPVLVLDEPTAGVDVELRRQLWDYVLELNRRGVTVLLTTHYLEEAEQLCDRIAIINHGRVVAVDEKQALIRRIDAKTVNISVSREIDELPPALKAFSAELSGPASICVHYQPSTTRIGEILDAVTGAGLGIVDLSTEETDLEDIFLQLTGGREEAPAGGPETA